MSVLLFLFETYAKSVPKDGFPILISPIVLIHSRQTFPTSFQSFNTLARHRLNYQIKLG